jgi:putative transposase
MMTYYKRRLPHWQMPGQSIFITWRLFGSLPPQIRPPKNHVSSGKTFVSFDRALDQAEIGPLWLKEPQIAKCVLSSLHASAQQGLFSMSAFVLMANHIHLLLEPQSPIAKITQQIKGTTSRQSNFVLGRTGSQFWQGESFDHWVRSPGEWQKIRTYIERNPVAAGLVKKPEDWPWSSASSPVK